MLQEQEPPIGLEHPSNLAQRAQRVRDRAEREGTDRAVECGGLIWQFLGAHMLETDRKRGLCNPLRHTLGKQGGGVDGIQVGDSSRIVRQVQSGAEADLHHVPMGCGE